MIIMYAKLPVYHSSKKFVFSPLFGALYSISGYDNTLDANSLNENNEYHCLVANPFLLQKREMCTCPKLSLFARFYAHLLVFLWRWCYPLIYLLSHLRLSIYKDAGEANIAFRQILKKGNQRILCLPRSVFIATTSAKFKSSGAMFIGCFFPSRHMHAWVVEEGMHADIFDNQWIMFTPIAMMK